jgi:hypothetical protein
LRLGINTLFPGMLVALPLEQRYYGDSDPLRTRRFPPLKAEEDRPIMAAPQELESARLSMLEARKAPEDYETLKGFVSSGEHTRLTQVFTKATETYLKLSASQR